MKRKIIINLLFSFLVFPLNAQETETLSLNSAINYALANKAEAQQAKLQIENSEYLIQEAKAGAFPHINANAGITYNPILQETAIPTSTFPGFETDDPFLIMQMGQKWNSVAGITLQQNLFDQTVFTGLKAAKTTREFYRINAELTQEQIIEKVANAYYNVFIQREQLKTIENSYENVLQTQSVIKSLYDNGLAREIDLDRVIVQLANLNSSRLQLINHVAVNENVLKFLIGMPIEQRIELLEEEFQVESFLLEDKIDIENRAEYRLLKKQNELLVLQKEAAQAAYYPKLSLSASYNYFGQGDRFPIGANISKGVYWSDFSAIGLNLSIPIFNGFGIKAKVNQAEIEIRENEIQIKDAQLGLDLEYQNAKNQIENLYVLLENQQQNVELANKVVNNTQSNYRLGLATLTDLLEAENALVSARNNYSNAVLQFKLAEVQLLKSKGELNTLIQ